MPPEMPVAQFPTVPTGPTPTAWAVTPVELRTDDGMTGAVLLHLATSTGITQVFVNPDAADEIAKALTNAARQARTGLVVPNGIAKP